MKQLTYYIKSVAIVTALAGFATSCDKTEEAPNLPQSQEITLTASTTPRIAENNPDTKVTYDPNGKDASNNPEMSVLWAAGDAFKMYTSAGSAGATFTLVGDGGSATGQFSTTDAVSDDTYNILFPAPGVTETRSWGDLTLSYLGQEYDGNVGMNVIGTNLSKYNYMISTVTIANSTPASGITFTHLGCVLQFTIEMPAGYTVAANGAPVELILTAPGMSSEIKPSAPTVVGTPISTQALKLTNVAPDGDRKFTAYMMSAPFTVPANETLSIAVKCDNGKTMSTYSISKQFTDKKDYLAGKRYSFTGVDVTFTSSSTSYVEIDGIKWAKGNIVGDGNNGLTFGAPDAQGLVFKWGSLVGVNMIAAFNSSTSVAFIPSEYKTSITKWGNVPYISQYEGYEPDVYIDYFKKTYSTGYDASSGKGDICRYMSAKGMVSGNWRMPKATEFRKLGAIQSKGGDFIEPAPLPSSSTGEDKISSGWTLGSSPATVFFPAGGGRDANGGLTKMGSEGYYWSCSPSPSYNFLANCLILSSTVADWSQNKNMAVGNSVRCVLE